MHGKICGHCGAEDSDLLPKKGVKHWNCEKLKQVSEKVKVSTAVSSVCLEEFWHVLTWIILGGKWKMWINFQKLSQEVYSSTISTIRCIRLDRGLWKPVRFQWVGAVSFQLPEAARWRSRVRWLFQCCHSSRGWLHGCSLARGSCRAGFHADKQTGRKTTRGKSQF